MVIQRWQSVLLFLGVLAMGLFAFLGTACIGVSDGFVCWHSIDCIPLFVLNCVTAIVAFIDIFLYNNLRAQKRVAMVVALMSLLSLALTVAAVLSLDQVSDNDSVAWRWTIGLPVAAVVFFIWARARMCADERLLKSYDRIR
ncbi:DUF4293 domain-containing protein [uncultured Muribaculum sp.]|uniref:DUF4293 domain-containing protein n=1 Tax=uncultured Muribaculum sp. TaxID=1918613 RepID=UPI0025CB79BA|nr:DUF4293 domain-containing protein [uncultured Muribaculum sp.]